MLFNETEFKFVAERGEHFFVYKIIASKITVSGVDYWKYRTFISVFPLFEEPQQKIAVQNDAQTH